MVVEKSTEVSDTCDKALVTVPAVAVAAMVFDVSAKAESVVVAPATESRIVAGVSVPVPSFATFAETAPDWSWYDDKVAKVSFTTIVGVAVPVTTVLAVEPAPVIGSMLPPVTAKRLVSVRPVAVAAIEFDTISTALEATTPVKVTASRGSVTVEEIAPDPSCEASKAAEAEFEAPAVLESVLVPVAPIDVRAIEFDDIVSVDALVAAETVISIRPFVSSLVEATFAVTLLALT